MLHDLLSAFEQDVRYTEQQHRYESTDELLGYCRLSANPVGRLLLHLYGVHDARSLQQSDQICSALQLINFWQDISRDLPNGRCYLPADTLQRHGLQVADFEHPALEATPDRQAVVAELCAYARGLMQLGAPLARRVPGRAGWELRLVVQGGLRILDAIAEHRPPQLADACDVAARRPAAPGLARTVDVKTRALRIAQATRALDGSRRKATECRAPRTSSGVTRTSPVPY